MMAQVCDDRPGKRRDLQTTSNSKQRQKSTVSTQSPQRQMETTNQDPTTRYQRHEPAPHQAPSWLIIIEEYSMTGVICTEMVWEQKRVQRKELRVIKPKRLDAARGTRRFYSQNRDDKRALGPALDTNPPREAHRWAEPSQSRCLTRRSSGTRR